LVAALCDFAHRDGAVQAANNGEIFAPWDGRTEARCVRQAEDVTIPNLAEDVDAGVGPDGDNLIYFICGENSCRPSRTNKHLRWMDDESANGWVWECWERKGDWQWEGADVNDTGLGDLHSWRTAVVSHFEPNYGSRCWVEGLNEIRSDSDVSPQLVLGVSLHNPNGSASRIGGTPRSVRTYAGAAISTNQEKYLEGGYSNQESRKAFKPERVVGNAFIRLL
jgi:hypothetical protein